MKELEKLHQIVVSQIVCIMVGSQLFLWRDVRVYFYKSLILMECSDVQIWISSKKQVCLIVVATGGGHLWTKGFRRSVSEGNRYGERLDRVWFIILWKV